MGRREGDFRHVQINTLDGKPVFSGRSYGERLEMGTESEKSRIIIMKSVLF
jgi:hypothetical protein